MTFTCTRCLGNTDNDDDLCDECAAEARATQETEKAFGPTETASTAPSGAMRGDGAGGSTLIAVLADAFVERFTNSALAGKYMQHCRYCDIFCDDGVPVPHEPDCVISNIPARARAFISQRDAGLTLAKALDAADNADTSDQERRMIQDARAAYWATLGGQQ